MSRMPDGYCRCLGVILIYTGPGKGKTSACIGQAVRALGHGMAVVFAQFLKRPGVAGEQKILQEMLGDSYRAGGLGFFRHEEDRADHRHAAVCLFSWATARPCQMLILDECLYALGAGLLLKGELEQVLEGYHRREDKSLVLSGRGMPDWLRSWGDIITSMECSKHAYDVGVHAVKGIEY